MVETSLMLALRPDLVRSQEIRDDAAREHPWYDLIPEPARHIPPSGVLANPSMATREIGERLCAMMLERLASALVREFGIVTRDAPATNGSAAGRPGSPESDNTCPTPTPGNQTAVSRELTGPTLGSRGHCGGENDLRLGDSAEDAGEPSAV
jgi:hypothetical protein